MYTSAGQGHSRWQPPHNGALPRMIRKTCSGGNSVAPQRMPLYLGRRGNRVCLRRAGQINPGVRQPGHLHGRRRLGTAACLHGKQLERVGRLHEYSGHKVSGRANHHRSSQASRERNDRRTVPVPSLRYRGRVLEIPDRRAGVRDGSVPEVPLHAVHVARRLDQATR